MGPFIYLVGVVLGYISLHIHNRFITKGEHTEHFYLFCLGSWLTLFIITISFLVIFISKPVDKIWDFFLGYFSKFNNFIHNNLGYGKDKNLNDILTEFSESFRDPDPFKWDDESFQYFINKNNIVLIIKDREYQIKKIYPKNLDEFKKYTRENIPEIYL